MLCGRTSAQFHRVDSVRLPSWRAFHQDRLRTDDWETTYTLLLRKFDGTVDFLLSLSYLRFHRLNSVQSDPRWAFICFFCMRISQRTTCSEEWRRLILPGPLRALTDRASPFKNLFPPIFFGTISSLKKGLLFFFLMYKIKLKAISCTYMCLYK